MKGHYSISWYCICQLTAFIVHFQYQVPVVPQIPCQMDKEATPVPLLGAESHTPVTQGTWWLLVVLVERVSQMANGQGVIQHVHVSKLCTSMPCRLLFQSPCLTWRGKYVSVYSELYFQLVSLIWRYLLPLCMYASIGYAYLIACILVSSINQSALAENCLT